jgi:hypothetical protein
MNYQKLKLNLEKYGRETYFAYVCDSYMPELRQDKKYRQWKRLVQKITFKSFSSSEKHILKSMLSVRVNYHKACNTSGSIEIKKREKI